MDKEDLDYYKTLQASIQKAKDVFYDEMNKSFTGDYLAFTLKIDIVSSDYSGILESISYTNLDNLLSAKK